MLSKSERNQIDIFSKQIRIETLRSVASIGFGHIGGSLSIVDLLAVLYEKAMKYDSSDPHWPERDYLVLSKGHAGPALYSTLALKGFFPMERLLEINRPHTILPSHCDRNLTPGVDMTAGSLGQGGSAAAGIALGLKMDGKSNHVYLIMGDGEIQEGQVWEMALLASQKKLDNLIAFVDNNGLQIDGTIDEVNSLGDIAGKFAAFGWYTQTVNGHDLQEIFSAIENAKAQKSQPSMIVLKTVKGRGWTEIEGQLSSHHRPVSSEDVEPVIARLKADLEKLKTEVCADEK